MKRNKNSYSTFSGAENGVYGLLPPEDPEDFVLDSLDLVIDLFEHLLVVAIRIRRRGGR